MQNDLQPQIKDFEQECKKSNPDQGKLKAILNYVCPITKDVGLMLVKYDLDRPKELFYLDGYLSRYWNSIIFAFAIPICTWSYADCYIFG